MFAPKSFAMGNLATMQQFIDEFGFGILVSDDSSCVTESRLQASHLPFLLKSDEGEMGSLYSHCARANPQWKVLDKANVLITFSGPHSYISPSWYQARPAVPTWNYAAVHVYGCVELTSKKQTVKAITALVQKYEPGLLDNQEVVSEHFVDKLLAGIVGFKIKIQKVEGVQKLGQQRNISDQLGVFHGLSRSDRFDSLALANYMSKSNLGIGNLK
ncbi:FMN-binding negative transcriptional regulator [Paraglaciecola marina]|uniref:FMN-binding negative transcriptional regulator n=1 Tax=Paraglaciecola marina TaxID=2500157 RepID=UPI00105B3E62|nr:FMN-binding negative transcriptional regulator [Paraglaciecola marina]